MNKELLYEKCELSSKIANFSIKSKLVDIEGILNSTISSEENIKSLINNYSDMKTILSDEIDKLIETLKNLNDRPKTRLLENTEEIKKFEYNNVDKEYIDITIFSKSNWGYTIVNYPTKSLTTQYIIDPINGHKYEVSENELFNHLNKYSKDIIEIIKGTLDTIKS